jgi:hypothetical protein
MVHALLAGPATADAIRAAFEEEGVPVTIAAADGDALTLARRAAADAPGLVGIGADGATIVVVLAAAPGAAYVEGPTTDARAVARSAARIVARRPLLDAPRPPVDAA